MAAERTRALVGYGTAAAIAGGPAPLAAHPRLVLLALDVAAVGLIAAAFAGAQDPDVLFHVLWIVLCVHAFLFGGLVGAARIVSAALAVLIYALAAGEGSALGPLLVDLDLEEWPLMLVIVTIVAVLAERVSRARSRYALLYEAARGRLVTAQEDERRLLAADLHDGVGQTLTALNLTLDAIVGGLDERDRDPATTVAVRRAQQLGGLALEEVRRVAYRLRPLRLEEVGLVAATQQLATLSGAAIAVHASPDATRPGLLAPGKEVEAYRIIQEAVANAMRHAQATRIDITMRRAGNRLSIDIVDDGAGFRVASARQRGLGFETMRERALAIGGELVVSSRPGRGTRVRLRIPMDGDPMPSQSRSPSGAGAAS